MGTLLTSMSQAARRVKDGDQVAYVAGSGPNAGGGTRRFVAAS